MTTPSPLRRADYLLLAGYCLLVCGFALWFDRVVPLLGKLAAEPEAYTYLPSSVKRFPGPVELGGLMAGVGLTDVRWILTAGGIIALHSGTVAG